MDATDKIIAETERLIKKYEWIISKYQLNGNKLINFISDREPAYKELTEQYLSSNS